MHWRSSSRLNRKVEREKLVLAALPELSLQIVEFARGHGRITMSDETRLTDGNRNTLKQHFRALMERGYLSPHGGGRGFGMSCGREVDMHNSLRQFGKTAERGHLP